MKKLIALLIPYRGIFFLAVAALVLGAVANSALTGLVSSLMNNVMTEQAGTVESQADKMFGYRERMEDIEQALKGIGIPLDQLGKAKDEALVNPIPWSIMAILVFLTQAFFNYLGTYTMGRIGLMVVVGLRQDLTEKMMALSMNFFKHYSTGDLIARVNTDVLRVQQAISVKAGEMIKESANVVVFVIVVFALNWKLSTTLFVLVPLVGLPVSIFSRKIRKYSRQSQSYLGHLTAHLKEVLVGVQIVKGFRREAFEAGKLRELNQKFLKYALRELRIMAVTTPVMGLIGMAVVVSFVCYGSFIIQSGEMNQGDFLFYLLCVYQLYQPIKRMARANSDIQQAVGVLPRLDEILQWNNDIPEPARPRPVPNAPVVSSIRFEDVSFRYSDSGEEENEDRAWVLDEVAFEVGRGRVIALVGASGSGKSTLAKLLPRFYDVSRGAIVINGVDIRDVSKSDLRALFALVTQDTVLFDDSIHNNIAYGMPDVPREDVIAAARKAFAHEFIERLPEGYETVIGESGSRLSGGQRQRISIARAILKDAPVLILDEATSALDTESEREVQQALDALMDERTTLVIAHRLSTIRKADQILVLDEGRVVERGNHAALLAENGLYRKLIQLQEEGRDAL
ncbi:ABC transporter ATP-binding protein [Acanthopleuribacter pedis]|uniref:ABC transporter ATP-binding protein n=1 Tax=Acanthopleuribacter pedis TaxID=442870 RepID=A0A8J7QEX5_9BACT|nr:ABC transporter ATP-binding protein [Acanthopleuribacter pedis]MBO1317125.1 ABC transporter ATP-binding protein [Acanthopleuribacter pedis]